MIISTGEMKDIMKIGGFIGPILGTLATSLLGNLLASKEVKAKKAGRRVIRAGDGIIR